MTCFLLYFYDYSKKKKLKHSTKIRTCCQKYSQVIHDRHVCVQKSVIIVQNLVISLYNRVYILVSVSITYTFFYCFYITFMVCQFYSHDTRFHNVSTRFHNVIFQCKLNTLVLDRIWVLMIM